MFCVRASWKLGLTQLHGSSAGLLCRLGCNTMVSSVQQIATRAFVSVLVVLARSYDVALAVSRDSSAEDLLKAYRRLLQKVSSCVRGFLCCRLLRILLASTDAADHSAPQPLPTRAKPGGRPPEICGPPILQAPRFSEATCRILSSTMLRRCALGRAGRKRTIRNCC